MDRKAYPRNGRVPTKGLCRWAQLAGGQTAALNASLRLHTTPLSKTMPGRPPPSLTLVHKLRLPYYFHAICARPTLARSSAPARSCAWPLPTTHQSGAPAVPGHRPAPLQTQLECSSSRL